MAGRIKNGTNGTDGTYVLGKMLNAGIGTITLPLCCAWSPPLNRAGALANLSW